MFLVTPCAFQSRVLVLNTLFAHPYHSFLSLFPPDLFADPLSLTASSRPLYSPPSNCRYSPRSSPAYARGSSKLVPLIARLYPQVFLKNMSDFAAMNATYGEYFSTSPQKPARSTVEVARLPKDVLVEIECVATYE